ncbi:MFS general substrate transporter [Ceraceosorus guamensis]|uniref:MFS general substrate transporter n=1 Tax=Ceraceosorus guamensis TaxID=1522189 RepID=A0A316VTI8_9BASI|nr:MFS general substrate transporter [Ceraceosorus guamensis]PWN39531.1 MFS general substrate transporter [Ceraceosorus guamensis]
MSAEQDVKGVPKIGSAPTSAGERFSSGGMDLINSPEGLASRVESPNTSGSASPVSQDVEKQSHAFNEQTNYLPPRKLIPIFLALAGIDFVALMDQTTLSVALPIIASDFNAGAQSSFVSSAYFISSTACQLLYGRVSDITGRKALLMAGLAVFFLGSLASSLAPDIITLSVFRAITGVGGGGLMTLAQIIVSDVVSLRQRGKYQGILGAVVALSNGVGPVIGGALASNSSWRNIFRLMLPCSFVGAVAAWVWMPLKPVTGNWRKKFVAIDWLGALLSLAAATLVVLGLTWASDYDWVSVHVLVPLLIGVATAFVFCLWQYWGDKPSRPALMPMQIFKSGIVCGACITQTINGWLFVTQVYFIPQFYQLAYGYTPTVAGALILPLTVVQTVASTLSGLLITWTGRYREILLLGWAMWSIGLGLFSTLDESSNLGKQIGFGLLAGVGVGATLQPSLIAIQGAVDRKQMAAVTATRMFVRNLGGALGLALAGTIVNNSASSFLSPLPGWDDERIRQALNNPSTFLNDGTKASSGAAAQALNSNDIAALRRGYRKGFRNVFILLASLGAFSFFVALFLMKQKTIDREDDAALREQAEQSLEKKRACSQTTRHAPSTDQASEARGQPGSKNASAHQEGPTPNRTDQSRRPSSVTVYTTRPSLEGGVPK